LGKRISEFYEIPWFDSDDFFWLPSNPPFSETRSREERIELLKSSVSGKKSFVLSGSIMGWGNFLMDDLELAIYKYVDREERLARLERREKEKFGARLEEGNDMFANHRKFMDWAMRYEDGDMTMRSRMSEAAWMEKLRCPIVRIERNISIAEEMDIVAEAIEKALSPSAAR